MKPTGGFSMLAMFDTGDIENPPWIEIISLRAQILLDAMPRRWSYGLRDGGRDRTDVDSAEAQMMSSGQKTGH